MSATSAIAALQTSYPIPPATTYVDTESSVTIPFTGWNERTGAIDFILNVELNDHSCTQLAFGHDLDADGDLAPEETELVIGYDCGTWFTRDELHNRYVEEAATPDPTTNNQQPTTRTTKSFTMITWASFARRPQENGMFFDPTWDKVKITTRGTVDTAAQIAAKFIRPGHVLFIR